jgi:hypothetical protein
MGFNMKPNNPEKGRERGSRNSSDPTDAVESFYARWLFRDLPILAFACYQSQQVEFGIGISCRSFRPFA